MPIRISSVLAAAHDWLILRPPWTHPCCAVVIFLLLSIPGVLGDSPTYDESLHLSSGYAALTRADYRICPEQPPLAKILAAAPLLLKDAFLPVGSDEWKRAEQFPFGFRFLYLSGNDPGQVLLLGRLSTLFWSALLILSVGLVAGELHGPEGSLIASALAAFFPALLAHGHLVTTDVAATTLGFLSTVALWRLLLRGTPGRAAAYGILIGGALCSKFSVFALLPAHAVMLLAWPVTSSSDRLPVRVAAAQRGACVFLAILAAWLTLWGVFQFRYSISEDPTFHLTWKEHNAAEALTSRWVPFTRDAGLLPEGFLHGYTEAMEHVARGHGSYLLGTPSSTGGWPGFFPFSYLVKTPFFALLLIGWGALGVALRLRHGDLRILPFIAPAVIYWGVAMGSRINIGVRHLLPAMPFMLLIASGIQLHAASAGWRKHLPQLLFVALCGLAFEVTMAAPHYLAFFNAPSLVFAKRHEMLINSDLDWGQDLGRLKRFLDQRGIHEIKLSYSGTASPRHLGLRHTAYKSRSLYLRYEAEWERSDVLHPGEWVAISAENLVTVFNRRGQSPDFRRIQPKASIGHSIFLYQVPSNVPTGP